VVYEILRGDGVDQDLDLIFDFLVAAAEEFGEDERNSFELAERRLSEIERAMLTLGNAPHQGTLRPHLGYSVRNVTKARAVFYFDVDDEQKALRILAVFFGGQDHEARILLRLLQAT
jgi:toxin ParE1/3/4